MIPGERLYQLSDEASPYSSGNTVLISALVALGAQFEPTQPYQEFRELVDGKPVRRVMWLLKEKTTDGTPVKDLVRAWRSPEWQRENPEHPLCYIKAALDAYKGLIDTVIKKAVPCTIVRRGKRIAVIPENATEERRSALLAQLEK